VKNIKYEGYLLTTESIFPSTSLDSPTPLNYYQVLK
jgi:hypothetical protein